MTVLTEKRHAGGYLVSEANGMRSREIGTIFGGDYEAGTVLGKILLGTVSRTALAGIHGNGTLTLAASPLGAGAKQGNYTVKCTGGTFSVGTPSLAGAGNGTCTLASPAFGTGVLAGIYKLRCTEKTTDSGQFEVLRPDGTSAGFAVVGTAFTGEIKFTIADGTTDFDQTSEWSITVSKAVATDSGKFSVVDPDGLAIGEATVGMPFTGAINFAIADGSTDFQVDDGWTVTVAAGSLYYTQFDPAAHNGAETAKAILFDGVKASTSAVKQTITARDTEVNAAELVWKTGVTTPQKTAGLAQLAELDIIGR